jgi:hypothetical protein
MAATVATPLERALGAIAGVTEMTSRSSQGSTRVTLQFDLGRTVDGAARDVQAAINASRTLLPSGMPSNPSYRKVNPADSPILILALTSATLTRGQMYDAASTVLAQKLSQVEGVGQATVSGGALPAVRVELDPTRLAANGISLEQVRSAITSTNGRRPLGVVEREDHYWQIGANDQASVAADYAPLVLRWNANGSAVLLRDVADVVNSVQDVRNYGVANGKPAILLQVYKQPGANILNAENRVRACMPQLEAAIPAAIDVQIVSDRTPTLRARCAKCSVRCCSPWRSWSWWCSCFCAVFARAGAQRGRAGVAHGRVWRHVPGRLHAGQPLAHGTHHCHGFRGGRRHCRAGEHCAPHGGRQERAAGGAGGLARDCLHRAFDEHFAGGGVRAHHVHGRRGGALVP